MNSPFIMVIFGATGDLVQNKLIPALFALFKANALPKDFFVIGFSRRDMSDDSFRKLFKVTKDFAEHLTYQSGDFSNKNGYLELSKKLEAIDKKIGACITRFFYLATPPDHYETILNNLVQTKLSEGCGADEHSDHSDGARLRSDSEDKGGTKSESNKWTRVIVEKPFGKDLETAKSLDKKLSEIFEEKQIFRVDHYLGKETVQNILAFRFANGIFEPVWSKNLIDHIQITWGEKNGIKNRGNFFDGVGLLRDAGQNHIMQLLSAVAMESPRSFTKEDLRDARAEVIDSIRYSGVAVRGQYEGYKNETDVSPSSDTETFVATKLFVDTPRFEGVPFYVRMGKKMPKDLVEISIVFIQTCHILFKEYGCPEIGNVLTFRIQPDEGINLRFIAKKPGDKLSLGATDLKFTYKESFGTKGLEAYEKILLDIFAGDQMLFNRSDELESSWGLIANILKDWENKKSEVYSYDNSWGPKEADELIEKDNRKWL